MFPGLPNVGGTEGQVRIAADNLASYDNTVSREPKVSDVAEDLGTAASTPRMCMENHTDEENMIA